MTAHTITLAGAVGGSGFHVEAVREFLEGAGGAPVRFVIASGGGSTATSVAIHHMIRDYSGEASALIEFAGSAAVAVALAAPRRAILAGGSIFTHRAWIPAVGTCADLEACASRLRQLDQLDAELYAEATGQPVGVILRLMDRSAVLDARQAVEHGFAHAIVDGPGGRLLPGEDWQRTALSVVRGELAELSDQSPERIQARGLAIYEAVTREPKYPRDPEPAGPALHQVELADRRSRRAEVLRRLANRLRCTGYAALRRRDPALTAWRCDRCGQLNQHAPEHAGRPTPCQHCDNKPTEE